MCTNTRELLMMLFLVAILYQPPIRFFFKIKVELTLYIVLSYKFDAVSVRFIISSSPRFTKRISKIFINIVLVRVMKALDKIHKKILLCM